MLFILFFVESQRKTRYLSVKYPYYSIDKFPVDFTHSRYYEKYIGVITDEERIINEFNKTFQNSSFIIKKIKNEDDISSDYYAIIEVVKKGDLYKFKLKTRDVSVSKLISDEESDLILPTYYYGGSDRILSNFSFHIHKILLNLNGKQSVKNLIVYSCPMISSDKIKMYINSELLLAFPLFISFVYGVIFLSISLRMIDEKVHKLDILLSRYGIKKYQYFLSWLLTYLILTIFTSICTIITFSYFLFNTFFPGIILFTLTHLIFSIAIFSMAFFTQTVINSLKTGQTLFKILFLGINILGIPVIIYDFPKSIKILFSIFPHIAQMENLQTLILLQFFNSPPFGFYFSRYHKVSFVESLCYLIFDIIFYIFGGFFVLNFKESGVDFITFILSPIYGKKRELIEENENNKDFQFNYCHQQLSQNNELLKEQKRILEIKNITKRFDDLIAVNNFCGELFPNEIFCLLGHNGAGKTTLIKVISGMEDPNEGDIFLNNQSLITNKEYLYENIGLCSQEDIFFDFLTVDEHLKYMCEIKGNKANMNEIDDLLTRIELLDKKYSVCKTLSGGQKRKLCIALALIGNSQLILLDEPTSGMDVLAKRALWNFLKNYKNNKIIILTTHSLDEAEYLGDRIGIMSEGHFLCSGSSSYLKDKYPCGYNINLILNSKKFTKDIKHNFLSEIKEIYNNVQIKISSKSLLSISCETIDERTKDIFNYIERVKENYGIIDYTIATTSLEDVFLKLNVNERTKNTEEVKLNEGLEIQNDPHDLHNEVSSFSVQLCENIKRSLIPLWRSKSNFILELISSLTILIIFIIMFQSFVLDDNSKYKNFSVLLDSNKIYVDDTTQKYLENSAIYKNEKINIKFAKMDFSPQYDKNNFTNSMINFVQNFYEHSNLYNEKVAIFHGENDTHIEFFLIYQSGNYYYKDIMNTLVSSAYLKSLGINAILFEEYANFKSYSNMSLENSTAFLFMAIAILIFSFISFSSYSLNQIVKEKETNIKHLLYLSGANMNSYWLGFLVVDLIKYFIFILISFTILISISKLFLSYLPLFIAFCFPMSIFLYTLSFTIDKEEQTQKSYFILLLAIAICVPISTSMIMIFIDKYFREFSRFLNKNAMKWFLITPFELTPITSLCYGIIRVSDSVYHYYLRKRGDDPEMPKPYILNIYHTCYFIVEFIVWGMILHLYENGCLMKIWHSFLKCCCLNKNYVFSTGVPVNDGYIIQNNIPEYSTQKPNDINSNYNINSINNSSYNIDGQLADPLLIDNNINRELNENKFVYEQMNKVRNNLDLSTRISGLTKTFCFCFKNNLRAVNNLYLGLEGNEKFGLLGFNGSGKSTTFKCITNEIYYDSGEISLFGYNTQTSFNNLRTIIGYCPQENPLFEYLTVRELLKFYKSLKQSKESIENICSKFGIEKYIDKYCIDLSGGNKRKLTFAIALMNYPKILLLDEPSTGVDPESRRIMWKNINELTLTGNEYNMILSTHSMEEAEILCDTVSWLKSGNFICVGNPEQLKILYSAGYKLHIKFKDDLINNNIKEGKYENKNLCDLNIIGADFINGLLSQNNNYNINNINQGNYHLGFYIDSLYNILSLIRDKCDKISVREIGKDYSFELNIIVKKEKQGELFHEILNMKRTNEIINEININMESLENILTNL